MGLISYSARDKAIWSLSNALRSDPRPKSKQVDIPNIVEWASQRFYVTETKSTIELQPVQKAVLQAFFERKPDGTFKYRTGLYSTIKKSGKTTIAALVQQWAAETWGDYGEIYHMGNKLGQAKERAFKLTRYSIELSPYANEWEVHDTKLYHKPTHSVITAIPVNAAGEAGGNQRLTTWTEFHGYVYEENERFWAELQPVPTQPLSFRFVESYAGYEGESLLLKSLWDRVLNGTRIHDEYPIYADDVSGTIGYIDTGVEARRMPWQTPLYYQQAEAEEIPSEYRRLHLNEWVNSENTFVDQYSWAACAGEVPPQTPYEPMVIALDAGIKNDCFAMVGVTKRENHFYVRMVKIWRPPKNQTIDLVQIENEIEQIIKSNRVAGVVYDPYQMERIKQTLMPRTGVWFEEFGQTTPRLVADSSLQKIIMTRQITHPNDAQLTEHVLNANAKTEGDKLRIVKRNDAYKIDACVALSMAVAQAGKWNIG